MKKIYLLLLILLSSFTLKAQTNLWFRTTEFAYKINNNWSEWESSDLKIQVNLEKEVIIIYSPEIQVYNILQQVDSPLDAEGKTIKYLILDQDNDYGYLRLRVQNNGVSQIYIDFSNVTWVYDIEKL